MVGMVRTAIAAALLLTAGMVAGCGSERAARSLDGTSWQLVSIQSMDDAQGTTSVPDPSKFTVTFGGPGDQKGRATLQLDCNRGNGSYEAKAADDGTSGSLTFGPIATTRMACSPPSLDQQVGTALSNVRSYLFADGKLHMSLLADGGILSWKPA